MRNDDKRTSDVVKVRNASMNQYYLTTPVS